jgi:formylglycine-generating enzyme required for sulfatase activity
VGGSPPDLRDEKLVPDYAGLPLTKLGATRIDPAIRARFSHRFQPCKGMPNPYGELKTVYTPAYEALIPFIRRVNIEDGASLLRPGEYHADTSELIQLLRYGHHGVQLDHQAWDRLITWIDLNGPCHGTWGEVADIPEQAGQRRYQLALASGGPSKDPELIPISSIREPVTPIVPDQPAAMRQQRARHASRLLNAVNGLEPAAEKPMRAMTLDLGDGVTIELVRISAGRFILGDTSGNGQDHEWPPSIVEVKRGFWIGRTEVTNAQFRRFLPAHSSGYFTKRQIDRDGPGVQLDTPNQPAVRVSWTEAMRFCRRMSEATGRCIVLPSEAQWEYAARAGTSTELWYGGLDADFSNAANMADRSLACLYMGTAGVTVLQPIPSVMSCDDLAIATAEVASYRANPWGLYDVHGNAGEWVRTIYRSYPYREDDGRNDVTRASSAEKRVVRGGSFYDRPRRCRSAHRRAYPAWQGVHDVGFRIVVEE